MFEFFVFRNYRFVLSFLIIYPFALYGETSALTQQELNRLEREFDSSFESNYLRCLEISKILLNNDKSIGQTQGSEKHLVMYAKALKMNSLYAQSLEVFYNLLKAAKSDEKRSFYFHQIGLVYDDLGNFERANSYYRKVLSLTADSLDMIPTLHAVADNYTLLRDFDSSYYYFQKLKSVYPANTEIEEIALIHFASMECLVALKKTDEIAKSAEYFSLLDSNDFSEYTLGYGYYAKGFYHQFFGNQDSAAYYFYKTADVCVKIGYISALKNVYRNLVDLYLSNQNFQAAFHVEMLRDSIEKVLLTQKELNMTSAFEVEYNAFEKNSQIYRQQIQLLNKSKQINNILYGILTLLVLLAILVLYITRIKKLNKTLVVQNNRIDFLLRELNHRVKNNLQILSSFIGLQINRVHEKSQKENLNDVRNRLMTLNLLQDLLGGTQNESLKSLASDLFKQLQLAMTLGEAKLILELQEVKIEQKKLSLVGLVLNEIYTNFLKHGMTHKEPVLTIQGTLKQDTYELRIHDNGVLNQTQNPDGLGTKIIFSLIRQLKGQVVVTKESGYGYLITFPISS